MSLLQNQHTSLLVIRTNNGAEICGVGIEQILLSVPRVTKAHIRLQSINELRDSKTRPKVPNDSPESPSDRLLDLLLKTGFY